ncbi:molybdopterin-synthase adenylyltransferase MoeB [Actibacterium sp. 188UL27-1]|uniref:HesA/MoeB/ThiF family protein n=1 Tax=Actibacterium sp. 188UL27-1 TaxID=2786961 RepID=UPI0019561645|nr:molybdopterin-synthase adenylyltransferase MoeB [Actibacterium sp. 188UL27-1]MBM7068112.1 molybdopterin-synthase adenylyltransferase MoeB [Actibacterium sp. 188UL27-1]
MLLVGVMGGAIWGIGHLMDMPTKARWSMIWLLLVAVLMAQVVLPADNPLRTATGGSAAPWLILIAFGAVIAGYRQLLGYLRVRADGDVAVETPRPEAFSETELDRYARHIILREIGGTGQKRLRDARILVIGAGGLGAPALMYLAGAGVGTIGLIDDDTVENANLQRQIIHSDARIGMPKVFSAETAMKALNPFVTVRPYNRRLTDEIADDLFADYDLVLDGTDNFATRYRANAAAVRAGRPLISGALTQWEGQISVFDPAHGAPCYQCIFPESPADGLAPSCAEAGVLGPLPGVIGAMMAVEAVKLITGAGTLMRGEMLIYDALYGETRKIGIQSNPTCPVCGAGQKAAVV